MNRLVLIDGNAILHRAYHALPPLTAPDGSPVGAVYGFTSMLLKIFHDLAPTHMAVAFDRAAPTFRKKMYKEYQAQRPEMEDELVSQVDKVHDVIAACGIPIYEMDGFEADDMIGTLSRQITNPKSQIPNKSKIQNLNDQKIDQVIIVTGDKDMLQLVEDERVFVYMPTKGLSEAKLYGEKDVVERLGVKPSQVVELKALAGDPSDNYPGVSGIGPKTAASLVEVFGSIENLYKAIKGHEARVRKFSDAVIAKLKEGEESARLSHDLATIKTDVPIGGRFEAMRVETLYTPEARKALEDLHFHSLLKRLGSAGGDQFIKNMHVHKVDESKKRKGGKTKTEAEGQQELF